MSGQFIDIMVNLMSPSAAATLENALVFQYDVEFTGATMYDNGGMTANGSNYRTIAVQNAGGTETYASWETKTSSQGTVASATLVNLVDGTDLSKAQITAGTVIKIRSAASGSGVAQNSSVNLKFRKIRSFS